VHPRARRRSGFPTWLAAWLVFSALGSLWALGSPLLSVPDEPAHAVYAAAAVRGQIWAPAEGHVTTVVVPRDFENIDNAPTCYAFQPNVPAGCAEALTDREGQIELGTRAGRYPPAYYLYAGLGSLVADGAKAIYAMRLLTVFAVAAFLASAACSILARRRRALGLAGLALATTPMLFFFAGAVNPQAPEIAAAILLWTSGAALLTALREDPDLPLTFGNADLRRFLAAIVLLPLMRNISFVWMGIILAVLVLAFGSRTALRRLPRARPVLAAVPLIAASLGVTAVWVLIRNTFGLGIPLETTYAGLSGSQALYGSATKLDNEYFEMIGWFGWLTTPSPGLVYVLFTVLLGGLTALTVLGSRTRQNVALALLVAAVVVVPVALEVQSYRGSGFAWQGRYTLPIAAGIPLLMGLGDGASRAAPLLARRFLLTASLGLAVVHVVAFGGALNRHLFGIGGFWYVTESGWNPPVPAWVLLAVAVAVAATVAWLVAVRGSAADLGGAATGDEDVAEPESTRTRPLPAELR
jgi:hypothetical protein